MREPTDIIRMLNKVFELKLEDKSLNFKDQFVVAPQVKEGLSFWAGLVKNGYLKPFHICWAFTETIPKKWLGLRIHIPNEKFKFSEQKPEKGNTFYFNLQSSHDRWKLKQLESEFKDFIKED
jgi:hypothetical protein